MNDPVKVVHDILQRVKLSDSNYLIYGKLHDLHDASVIYSIQGLTAFHFKSILIQLYGKIAMLPDKSFLFPYCSDDKHLIYFMKYIKLIISLL